MVSHTLSEDEKVNSSITDICSPDTTYLDLMIMYAAKRKGKSKSFKLNYVNDMKWKGDNMKENNIKTDNNMENKSLVKTLFISGNKKSYTKPVILKSGNLLSEDKQKQYSDMY